MMTAAGTMACESVRVVEAIVLKIMDMANTVEKAMRMKKKKAPGSRRNPVMKYSVRLKTMVLAILYGKSHNMEAMASADG
jgi:hypothetical protein